MFIRVRGSGAVLLDVGRLVVGRPDGSTEFASAMVITPNNPDIWARIDAAVCGLF